MKEKKIRKSIVKTFLTEKQRIAFKSLCSLPKNNTTMQEALEDYIIDCIKQKELL